MEKASHHFFFARLSMKGIQWFCFGEDGGLKIQDVFFTKVSRSSSIIEFGFGFCLLLYFFCKYFSNDPVPICFSEFEPCYFSAFPAQGHVFFNKTSCRRECSLWGLDVGLVTASLGHPFGSLESWILLWENNGWPKQNSVSHGSWGALKSSENHEVSSEENQSHRESHHFQGFVFMPIWPYAILYLGFSSGGDWKRSGPKQNNHDFQKP